MTGFWAQARSCTIVAITSVLAVMAALLTLSPAHGVTAERLPADDAVVRSVPVLSWPAVDKAVKYELQVSTTSSFSNPLLTQTRETPSYVFADDLAPGKYYWRYRGIRSDGSRMTPSAAWSFTRGSQSAPTLLSPDDDETLDYPTMSPVLTWLPVPSFGNYTVQWDDNSEFRSPKEATTVGSAFTVPDLLPQDPEKVIYWRVRAGATSLTEVATAWSTVRSFTVAWATPDVELLSPRNTTSVDDAVDQPVFSWAPTAGAASYELQIALDDKFTTLVFPPTGVDYASTASEAPFIVDSTTYVPPSRYPAKSHWWRVRALDGNGAPGPWYPTGHFTRRWTEPNEPIGETFSSEPAARPNNVILDDRVPIDQFEVTWDAVPDTTFYEVEVSTDLAFHDGKQRIVCRTPHTSFAPGYEGSYLDAGREYACPINVPPSAMPPVVDAWYVGDGEFVAVSGSGVSVDSYVLLNFGAGDPDNGNYIVVAVVPDDPDTPEDESAFVVRLNRPGSGPVQWQLQPGLVLAVANTYDVRVRAVHETTHGGLVYGVWSDQANTPGGTVPTRVTTLIEPPTTGSTALSEPATLQQPASDTTWSDWPVLRWDPVTDAEGYLVAIAKDREFTNPVLADLDSGSPHFEYYVTRSTVFVPETTLAENTAGGSYYWYVLPCTTYTSARDNICAAPDRDAILQSGRWRSFHKQSNALTGLEETPATDEPAVVLSWDDTYQSNPLGTGGFSKFELQITDSTWTKATTLATETARLSTAGMSLEPATRYRWRVRAIDGGLLPMPWAEGDEFDLPSFPGPQGLAVRDSGTTVPCLTWDAAQLASGYDIEIFAGTDEDFPDSAMVQTASIDYPGYCVSDLPAGAYGWRVRSVHTKTGTSQWTESDDTSSFTIAADVPVLTAPAPAPDPDTPTRVTVRTLNFAWTSVEEAAAYLVEWSTDDFWTVAGEAKTVTNAWSPNELEPGTYSWRVKVLDANEHVLSTSDASSIDVVRLAVTDMTPVVGPTAGGTAVTITGTGFDPAATVSFGTVEGSITQRSGTTELTVTTPEHANGPVDVVVTNPDGETAYAPAQFRFLLPPTLTGLSPTSGPTAGGTSVTLSGTDFDADAIVTFEGSEAEVTSHSSTEMVVKTPPHAAGVTDVVITNPDGQQSEAQHTFTYVAPPSIVSVAPPTGTTAGGTMVLITGTDFHADAEIWLDGIEMPVTSRTGSTGLTFMTEPHTKGLLDLTVINPDGQEATARFAFVEPPAVTAFSPTSGPTRGGTTVTITGSGFDAEALVTVGGTRATVSQRDGTTGITVVTPPHVAGSVELVVLNPDGQFFTAAATFTYVAPPAITKMTPTSGPTEGGTEVTLTGAGFDPAATVTFGGVQGKVTDRTGDTTITVTTPRNAAGEAEVVVTNPDAQTAIAATKYTYVAPPRVTVVAPPSGPVSGYTSMSIIGTDFSPEAEVTLDGTPATVTERAGTVSLTVLTPAHPEGTVDVEVTNPDGQSATISDAFTYVAGTSATTESATPPWFVSAPRVQVLKQRLAVRWSRPTSPGAPADAYRLMVKRDSGKFRTVITTSSRRVRISIRRGHTYWVRVVPHSSAGWGLPGPTARRQVR